MILGSILFAQFWVLMITSAILPLYSGWTGYRRAHGKWVLWCAAYIAGIAVYWLLYSQLDNSESLRNAFGSETHEGLGLGIHLITTYIATPVLLGSAAAHIIGKHWAKRKPSQRDKAQ